MRDYVYDMSNAFTQARSFDPSRWKEGHAYRFTMIDGNKSRPTLLKYRGKTTVKADNGRKYRCLHLLYMERDDGKSKRVADFYASDGTSHAPIRLDMFLKFGSVRALLVGMRDVRNNMAPQIR